MDELHSARFEPRSPHDLLAKLDYDRARLARAELESAQAATFAVMDCAVAAWHLVDWVEECLSPMQLDHYGMAGTSRKQRREVLVEYLDRRIARLAVCRQLATGAKHFVVSINPNPTLSTQVARINQQFRAVDCVGPPLVQANYWPLIHVDGETMWAIDLFAEVWGS